MESKLTVSELEQYLSKAAWILKGGYLVLHGMATKSLYVETGAEVEIPGMVTGEIINNDGK